MTSSNPTSGEHQIYKVVAAPHQLEGEHHRTQYFSVYWEHGSTGFKYVYPNIEARDEMDAYVIVMKKLEIEGADNKCLLTLLRTAMPT
jgi:hypothetical protein